MKLLLSYYLFIVKIIKNAEVIRGLNNNSERI